MKGKDGYCNDPIENEFGERLIEIHKQDVKIEMGEAYLDIMTENLPVDRQEAVELHRQVLELAKMRNKMALEKLFYDIQDYRNTRNTHPPQD
jgi:hypothetical protein